MRPTSKNVEIQHVKKGALESDLFLLEIKNNWYEKRERYLGVVNVEETNASQLYLLS